VQVFNVLYVTTLHIYTAALNVCLTCTIQMAREYYHYERLLIFWYLNVAIM